MKVHVDKAASVTVHVDLPREVELNDQVEPREGLVRPHEAVNPVSVADRLALMRDGRVLPYLDVPFQHASPRILKLMKRPANAENTLARIKAWRAICPELTIRSTFIAGFPGET